jgi:geranylgeranyl diphosphate synthase, type I
MILRILMNHASAIKRALQEALRGDSRLRSILRYHVGLEDQQGRPADECGKLVRPSLLLFVAEELGVSLHQALPAAVGIELIHGFSLLHDDIQDRDATRRGRPAAWTVWGASEAINAGDLMQTLAVTSALRAGVPATNILMTATAEMIEGQSLDLSFESRHVRLEEYYRMIDLKTGALLRASLEMGGVLAESEPAVLAHLTQLGRALGRAFQIQDDLLGTWGDSDVLGKPAGSDIRRRKQSYPAILAFERSSAEDRRALTAVYSFEEPVTEDHVTQTIRLMTRLGIREAGKAEVCDALAHAHAALNELPFSSEGKADMVALLDYLARRRK